MNYRFFFIVFLFVPLLLTHFLFLEMPTVFQSTKFTCHLCSENFHILLQKLFLIPLKNLKDFFTKLRILVKVHISEMQVLKTLGTVHFNSYSQHLLFVQLWSRRSALGTSFPTFLLHLLRASLWLSLVSSLQRC